MASPDCRLDNDKRAEPMRIASVAAADITARIDIPRIIGIATIRGPQTDILC